VIVDLEMEQLVFVVVAAVVMFVGIVVIAVVVVVVAVKLADFLAYFVGLSMMHC
jgi:hypothetical protein